MTLSASPHPIRLAVDVGGTFTDIVLLHGARRFTTKVLTTPSAPETGVLAGVDEILTQAGLQLSQVGLLILGSTLATNALIERKGATTALITTAGFRDLVEIGLEDRFAQYDIFLEKALPLVPRERRHGVAERIDGHGRVLRELDETAVAALAPRLIEQGVESVAVVFLHGYANAQHERRVREILKDHAPQLWVSLASDVCPEIREYERLSTTCANAYVQPLVAGYLERLQALLAARGLAVPLFLMTSGGAITTLQAGIEQPVRLVESGPAGGAVLARRVAEQLGETRALSFDMGGTTAKICFIDDYTPQLSRSFEFGRVHRHLKGSGLPIRIPVIEMVEIGAGGGSIARVDSLQRLQVGPDSAGSDPGPACYQLGGEAATVTDANGALGVIDPARFARGKVTLDLDAARAALRRNVANPLALDVAEAAFATTEIVTENMANAARVHATELGKRIEEYTLIAFGGAAPLHAATLARKLGLRRVVIPQSAGVGSALGFLWAPIAYQSVRSLYQRLDALDLPTVNALLDALRDEAQRIVRQAAPDTPLAEQRIAYMRYAGQGHEVPIALPAAALTDAAADDLGALFAQSYASLYGRTLPNVAVEIISWSVGVSAPSPQAETPATPASAAAVQASPQCWRDVYDFTRRGVRSVPVYERTALPAQATLAGPALVVEDETTSVVVEGFSTWVDGHGHLILELTTKESA